MSGRKLASGLGACNVARGRQGRHVAAPPRKLTPREAIIAGRPSSQKLWVAIQLARCVVEDVTKNMESLLKTYDSEGYGSMNDDEKRNAVYRAAIRALKEAGLTRFLEWGPGGSACLTQMILDPKNGPTEGVQVTCVEGNPKSAAAARGTLKAFMAKSGSKGKVVVLDGMTSDKHIVEGQLAASALPPLAEGGVVGAPDTALPGPPQVVVQEILGFFAGSENLGLVVHKYHQDVIAKLNPGVQPPVVCVPDSVSTWVMLSRVRPEHTRKHNDDLYIADDFGLVRKLDMGAVSALPVVKGDKTSAKVAERLDHVVAGCIEMLQLSKPIVLLQERRNSFPINQPTIANSLSFWITGKMRIPGMQEQVVAAAAVGDERRRATRASNPAPLPVTAYPYGCKLGLPEQGWTPLPGEEPAADGAAAAAAAPATAALVAPAAPVAAVAAAAAAAAVPVGPVAARTRRGQAAVAVEPAAAAGGAGAAGAAPAPAPVAVGDERGDALPPASEYPISFSSCNLDEGAYANSAWRNPVVFFPKEIELQKGDVVHVDSRSDMRVAPPKYAFRVSLQRGDAIVEQFTIEIKDVYPNFVRYSAPAAASAAAAGASSADVSEAESAGSDAEASDGDGATTESEASDSSAGSGPRPTRAAVKAAAAAKPAGAAKAAGKAAATAPADTPVRTLLADALAGLSVKAPAGSKAANGPTGLPAVPQVRRSSRAGAELAALSTKGRKEVAAMAKRPVAVAPAAAALRKSSRR